MPCQWVQPAFVTKGSIICICTWTAHLQTIFLVNSLFSQSFSIQFCILCLWLHYKLGCIHSLDWTTTGQRYFQFLDKFLCIFRTTYILQVTTLWMIIDSSCCLLQCFQQCTYNLKLFYSHLINKLAIAWRTKSFMDSVTFVSTKFLSQKLLFLRKFTKPWIF